MPPMIPNFNDPEWNERRISLQEALGMAAERLADHMAAPCGMKGVFEFDMADGRVLIITLEAGERPKVN